MYDQVKTAVLKLATHENHLVNLKIPFPSQYSKSIKSDSLGCNLDIGIFMKTIWLIPMNGQDWKSLAKKTDWRTEHI